MAESTLEQVKKYETDASIICEDIINRYPNGPLLGLLIIAFAHGANYALDIQTPKIMELIKKCAANRPAQSQPPSL